MAQILLLLFVVTIFISALTMHLPPYIKPCHRDDPDIAKCIEDHSNEAIRYLIHGDKEFNFPSLDPMIIPQAVVDKGKEFKLKMSNLSVYGFDTVRNIGVKVNSTTLESYQNYALDRLSLVGNYEIEGKILLLPISGKGNANITLVNPVFHLTWNLGTTIRDGVKYLTLIKAAATYDVECVIYKIDNLFNGNKELGDSVNKALNDNWKVLHDEFGAVFSQILMGTIRNNSLILINSVPFDEILP